MKLFRVTLKNQLLILIPRVRRKIHKKILDKYDKINTHYNKNMMILKYADTEDFKNSDVLDKFLHKMESEVRACGKLIAIYESL